MKIIGKYYYSNGETHGFWSEKPLRTYFKIFKELMYGKTSDGIEFDKIVISKSKVVVIRDKENHFIDCAK